MMMTVEEIIKEILPHSIWLQTSVSSDSPSHSALFIPEQFRILVLTPCPQETEHVHGPQAPHPKYKQSVLLNWHY